MNDFLKKNMITVASMLVCIAITYGVMKTKLDIFEQWVKGQQDQINVIRGEVNDLKTVKIDIQYIKEQLADIKYKLD